MQTFRKMKLMCQYSFQKACFAYVPAVQAHRAGQIAAKDIWITALNNMLTREMLYLSRSKDLAMAPTITPTDTIVIRRFPTVNSSCPPSLKKHLPQINVGDVVVLQDPSDSKNDIIRRLAAVEGHEMVSTNEDGEPFVIEKGQGWVLADNRSLSPKESKDSRTYGPISMSDIVGRVVYWLRAHGTHGYMVNNILSMKYDLPIIHMEMRIRKQTKNAKD